MSVWPIQSILDRRPMCRLVCGSKWQPSTCKPGNRYVGHAVPDVPVVVLSPLCIRSFLVVYGGLSNTYDQMQPSAILASLHPEPHHKWQGNCVCVCSAYITTQYAVLKEPFVPLWTQLARVCFPPRPSATRHCNAYIQ